MVVKITSGLGNQMFQYAFFLALKDKYPNYNSFIDCSFYSERKIHNGFELERLFNIHENIIDNFPKVYNNSKLQTYLVRCLKKIPIKKVVWNNIIIENGIYYFPNILNRVEDMYFFDGYWQTEDYFTNISDKVRNTFHFSDIIDIKNIELLKEINSRNSVSIHIRRGDYLATSRYINLAETKYYNNAIKKIKENISNPLFVLFSDDINWCKKNFGELGLDIRFVDWNRGVDSYKDMQLMAQCQHNIIANSSFSWWGAWLNCNNDKMVLAPCNFFRNCNYDESHLIPISWKKMDLS